jgi:hypothetical protein
MLRISGTIFSTNQRRIKFFQANQQTLCRLSRYKNAIISGGGWGWGEGRAIYEKSEKN